MTEYHKNILKHDYTFEIRQTPNMEQQPPIIKVVGVGGAGSNAVSHMLKYKDIKGVEYVVCNTDKQALSSNITQDKIQLGADLLKGLGAGTDAATGRAAAEESIEYIKAIMKPPIQMVFITAGMGGGTGTGAAPIVAQVAKEMGMLTVAVVTAPRNGEGRLKKKQALEGINLLKEHCDTVLVVLNDQLAKLHGSMPRSQANKYADDVLANAVKSIAEIITIEGQANSDFMDVKRILENAGTSVMASATAAGDNRAILAIEEALKSPLLNNRDIKGAKRILITLTSSTEFETTYDDETAIGQYMASLIGGETDQTKIGTVIDDSLGDKLQVTVIAAGFEDSHLPFTEGMFDDEVKIISEPIVIEKNLVMIEQRPFITEKEPFETVIEPMKVYENAVDTNAGNVVTVKIVPQLQEVDTPKKVVEPKEDMTVVNQMIQDIVDNKYTEKMLDMPAYLRQKIVFENKPAIPDGKFDRVKLDTIPR